MSPRQIDDLTFAEFDAMTRGFALSRGAKAEAPAPTADEYFKAAAAAKAAGPQSSIRNRKPV